jgi:cell division protein FtsB
MSNRFATIAAVAIIAVAVFLTVDISRGIYMQLESQKAEIAELHTALEKQQHENAKLSAENIRLSEKQCIIQKPAKASWTFPKFF